MYSYQNLKSIVNEPQTPLCEIMNRHGSDKGSGHHNYTKLYHRLFEKLRNSPINILEIGIGSINPHIPSNMECGRNYVPGSSIRGWREYFPNSTVYCCDIDTDTFKYVDNIYNVKPFYLDMTNQNCIDDVCRGILHDVKFDIIIDDGLHHFPTNCNLMKSLLSKLKPVNSFYIIEDIINAQYHYRYIDFKSIEKNTYQYVKLENPHNLVDNNIFIVGN